MSDNIFDECDDIPTLIHQLVGLSSPFYGIDTEKCYISGCQCGRPKYVFQALNNQSEEQP